jgi:hypothetical protein
MIKTTIKTMIIIMIIIVTHSQSEDLNLHG